MAPTPPKTHPKLPTLPSNYKIQKRPLLHPPIAAPRTNASVQKVVYVSASSPFISTIKRVRKLLSHVENRAAGPIKFGARSSNEILKDIEAGVGGKAREEEVVMKATGKAIEKLLGIALYWQGQDDVLVRIRTGSVGAVDDVVDAEGVEEDKSRVRRTSCLEVGVRLR